jgi:hypothetical protein
MAPTSPPTLLNSYGDTPIDWYVAEPDAATEIRRILDNTPYGSKINIIYKPAAN